MNFIRRFRYGDHDGIQTRAHTHIDMKRILTGMDDKRMCRNTEILYQFEEIKTDPRIVFFIFFEFYKLFEISKQRFWLLTTCL